MSTVFDNIIWKRVGHPALFSDLCRHHALNRKTRKALNQIISELNLEKPAMIFVDPTILQEGINNCKMPESVEMLQELYGKWFGSGI